MVALHAAREAAAAAEALATAVDEAVAPVRVGAEAELFGGKPPGKW
jgi:hypothetical protein